MKSTYLETNENGVKWYEVSGDYQGVYGLTRDGRVLDCDGLPMTDGDIETVCVKQCLGS